MLYQRIHIQEFLMDNNEHVYKILGDISSCVPSTSRFRGTVPSCRPLSLRLCPYPHMCHHAEFQRYICQRV